ncbi:MAG: 4-oxalomesaconate tautomerase [Acidimicrobiales bacterium]
MSDGLRAMLMRGGTSKGLLVLEADLPAEVGERDDLLLRVMGSPDPRQIDGVGGAHPLTSKVGVIAPSSRPDADVEYLFLQVGVDAAVVTDRQNCGNILAAVAPFAIERGLVAAGDDETEVRIYLRNTEVLATARVRTAGGQPVYGGDTAISGVPGTASPIDLFFEGIAGSTCGALLPTGSAVDALTLVDGTVVRATCVDNGMPTVVLLADELGISGTERPAELEADERLRADLEHLRLAAGKAMDLGDVTDETVPKLTMVSPPRSGGAVSTRTFIPHRCHEAIGVLGAVSVATACLLDGTPASAVAEIPDPTVPVSIEHPTGHFDCVFGYGDDGAIVRAGVVRTARRLFDGVVYPREDR